MKNSPGLDLVAVLGLSSQFTHHRHKGRRLVVPVDPGAVEKVKVKTKEILL